MVKSLIPGVKYLRVINWKTVNGKIQIRLPVQTSGHLIWNNKNYPLKGGDNDFLLSRQAT
jgi:hypothetical protein